MDIAESRLGDCFYGVKFGGVDLDTGGIKSVGFRLRLYPTYKNFDARWRQSGRGLRQTAYAGSDPL